VILGDHLYVIGGAGSATSLITVEQAAIAADGSLGPFQIVPGVSLSEPRSGHTSVVLGKFVYNVGGMSDSAALASIERAPIGASGSLGSFAAFPGAHLVTARVHHASIVVGNTLYVLGGEVITNGVTTPLDSVERSTIAPDGSPGPFEIVPGVKLVTARAGLTAAALGGQVYVLGGRGPAGRLRSVERAALVSGP
jgi:hypothetical protein